MFWFFPAAFGNNWWRWKWWWQWKWWWWWWWWWRCAGARSRPGPDSVCRKPRINVNSQLEREWDPQLKLENDTLSRPFQTIANEYMRAKRRSYRQLFSVDDFRLSQSLFRIFFSIITKKVQKRKSPRQMKEEWMKIETYAAVALVVALSDDDVDDDEDDEHGDEDNLSNRWWSSLSLRRSCCLAWHSSTCCERPLQARDVTNSLGLRGERNVFFLSSQEE